MLHRMIPDELPAQDGVMHYDVWTHRYHDTYNDIWLNPNEGRTQWELASREPGNKTKRWGKFHDVQQGLAAANALHAEKRA